ncbi:Auxin Efflux Carrier [Arcobacter nitrofigilis DSM 7299]|uniref:Auxin Efflux Carrier n=1 Tax=Arcobacter nitrofigilis (strain ATCC 33309 / DSM 7299 / CCUG 15893 / LMG 7604 / NCTC 12251 / CI) TaxID=572480 RepID=D5V471_ARCNC|nr:Auxin Efflux Carrier [Arcobacter nitrofigilis DSM 7299]
MQALISVATIYLFILIGFVFKKSFKGEVNERTLVLLNLYFLQPLLVFWGLTRAPITEEFLLTPVVSGLSLLLVLVILYLYSLKFFKNDVQDKSIFLASSLVGNTGNLGIPLGIAIFGLQSVPYTSIINIVNVFYMYIFSIYFFTGEKFSIKSSLKAIFKMPAIHVTFIALLFNYYDFHINSDFEKFFTMGAYTAIVMQLIIFGIFMSDVKIKSANWHLALNISLFKHFILPSVGLCVIFLFDLPPLVSAIIFMELFVPLAVNNVNLASLYKCKPVDATFSVLVSSFIFVILTYGYILLINYFFGL